MLLNERLAAHGVVLLILKARCIGVKALAVAHVGKRRQRHRLEGALVGAARKYRGAANIAHFGHGDLLLEPPRYLALCVLAHAVHEHIRARIDKDRPAHLVLPIVIMRKAPERRLKPADYYGHVRAEGLARTVGVDYRGSVRAQSRLLAGRIEILAAALFGGGVVCDHGVEVARSDQNRKARAAECGNGIGGVPIRLSADRDAKAVGFQNSPYHRRAEARMVNICVARYEQKVIPPPAALVHLLLRNRQKIKIIYHISSPRYQPDVPLCLTRQPRDVSSTTPTLSPAFSSSTRSVESLHLQNSSSEYKYFVSISIS